MVPEIICLYNICVCMFIYMERKRGMEGKGTDGKEKRMNDNVNGQKVKMS